MVDTAAPAPDEHARDEADLARFGYKQEPTIGGVFIWSWPIARSLRLVGRRRDEPLELVEAELPGLSSRRVQPQGLELGERRARAAVAQ